MNIEDAILKTLMRIIDRNLSKGVDTFDATDLESETVGDESFKHQPAHVLRLVLKPLLTQELRELLEKIFRNDPKAVEKLIQQLSKGQYPKAVRDFIISTLAKGLKHQYEGPRRVLSETLILSKAQLRHEYAQVMNNAYQHAMDEIAQPTYRPYPKPTPRPVKNRKDDE